MLARGHWSLKDFNEAVVVHVSQDGIGIDIIFSSIKNRYNIIVENNHVFKPQIFKPHSGGFDLIYLRPKYAYVKA